MKVAFLILFMYGFMPDKLYAQAIKHDTILIKMIDTMFRDDQFWRKEYMKVNKKEKSAYDEETIEARWKTSDSINELMAKAIINKYGYPGYNLVGKTSDNFWAIVQHCDDDAAFQYRVLALMKREVAKNNASKADYACLVDRVLVNKHQKQLYGAQIHLGTITHKSSPFPLKYPKSVNKLRKEMGLGHLEVYLKNFN